ncbi:hypothetical protein EAI_13206 [Harpegnathos saltator]|uniref:Uncharacterized protein n=1 Tax=Harpegnathos saltator TaxID=610380 RepID=E2C6A6_HARSA|nr:hypothetical protein EAI_13206 [Harpegnathos saltator]
METTFADEATISYVQNLAKCDITKEELTDAIEYLRDVLIQFNLINNEAPRKLSKNSKLIGGKLFEKLIKLLGKHKISDEVEYYIAEGEDVIEEDAMEDVQSSSSDEPHTSQRTEDYEPPQKVAAMDLVPYDVKLKIVMTANEHPNWSFRTLQSKFKQHLHYHSEVARFRKYIITYFIWWKLLG